MTSTTHTDVETEIRQLLAELEAGLQAEDADRILACYAPDAMLFDLAPPLRHPVDADGLRAWLSKFGGSLGYEIHDVTVVAGEDVAFAYGLHRMYADGDEGAFSMWFRGTVGLRRIYGAWRIVHAHESTPFYMDGSFTAATDLEP